MLIKEYRIPMPMTVEEYRIAQLYMIQKKSRDESQGAESGVEIIENEPYTGGPGPDGCGQHTLKIYHISKHIPSWLASFLPKNALIVEEEAWNAYPYTKTRYTCPFVEKFSIEIETMYFNDPGDSENVFKMSSAESRNTVVDLVDIVKEKSSDYKKEEDPKVFKSNKTGRGPLNDEWLSQVVACPQESRPSVMCAYKRCKVEFKYWGMQSKIEKFIHDIGLRKVMLRAHKQAWCWQDEWYGLNIDDIRRLEKETQLALQLKFGNSDNREELSDSETSIMENEDDIANGSCHGDDHARLAASTSSPRQSSRVKSYLDHRKSSGSVVSSRSKLSSTERYISQINLLEGGIEGIRRYSSDDSSDDDEFFDARDDFEGNASFGIQSMPYNWGSIENLAEPSTTVDGSDEMKPQTTDEQSDSLGKTSFLFLVLHGGNALEQSNNGMTASKQSDLQTLKSTFDSVVKTHYKPAMGRVAFRLVPCSCVCNEAFRLLENLNPCGYQHPDARDTTMSSSLLIMFASMTSAYQDAISSLATSCNLVYNNFLDSPEGKRFDGQVSVISDTTSSIVAYDLLCRCPNLNQSMYSSSRRGSSVSNCEDEEEDLHLSAPSSPSLRLTSQNKWELSAPNPAPRRGSAASALGIGSSADSSRLSVSKNPYSVQLRRASANSSNDVQRSSSYTGIPPQTHSCPGVQAYPSQDIMLKLDFEVSDFFMLGSPLGLVLAMRQLISGSDSFMPSQSVTSQSTPPRPACNRVYNLFYSGDPSSARIEPLLDSRFANIAAAAIAKYQQSPLGDGQSFEIGDILSSGSEIFTNGATHLRRSSGWSMSSGSGIDLIVSGKLQQNTNGPNIHDDDPVSPTMSADLHLKSETLSVASRWWGEKRIDYALFYPEALTDFPSSALPHLFYASFWESHDLAAFVLRQVVKFDFSHSCSGDGKPCDMFTPSIPKEKWQKKRTQVKIRNMTANHRSRDCLVLENQTQVISARFAYGLLDMVNLTGEKVDVYAMLPPPASEWIHLASDVTNSHGKVSIPIPEAKSLGMGIYPLKMVVRGDHTMADSYLAVLPPHTDAVVFSIHGALSASVSIMGSDPKVRPGAVDVVRLWQDKGYLIIYITARPDIQKHGVVTWLAQHNFPHGLIWFGDGLSHEPLKQKALLLKNMKTENKLNYTAAYGSTKDISVYSQLEIPREQIYVIGKTSKKQAQLCSVVNKGYATHLDELVTSDGIVTARYNATVSLRKSCFHLPGSKKSRNSFSMKRRASGKKQSSFE